MHPMEMSGHSRRRLTDDDDDGDGGVNRMDGDADGISASGRQCVGDGGHVAGGVALRMCGGGGDLEGLMSWLMLRMLRTMLIYLKKLMRSIV